MGELCLGCLLQTLLCIPADIKEFQAGCLMAKLDMDFMKQGRCCQNVN